MGISGRLARFFLHNEITPLLALVGFLLGVFALMLTPSEEEPQIDVIFANVMIAFPGASAKEVESLVTTRAEKIVAEVESVKHIYSLSQSGLSTLTVEFEVGVPRTESLVRLYNAFYSNQDWLPKNLGVEPPIIKPMGIDDVPILTLTLWSKRPDVTSQDLLKLAHTLEVNLQQVGGARNVYTVGGDPGIYQIVLDPKKLSALNIGLQTIQQAVLTANYVMYAAPIVTENSSIIVQLGAHLNDITALENLIIKTVNDHPLYLREVATVKKTISDPKSYTHFLQKDAKEFRLYPAVTVAVSKKPGENAAHVATQVIDKMEALKGTLLPDSIEFSITRNYGETATDKVHTLIKKLIFATLSVIILVVLTLGWREALVVGSAVVLTLLITLFASWALGFTLNRVSLFALIFSIGILVDDAIVVVENMHRHWLDKKADLVEVLAHAVNEVGNPTILATFTVIAALLPMAFVSGLMGPYMSPIPINASIGMFISLAIAFIFTPWLFAKVFKSKPINQHATHAAINSCSYRFFAWVFRPFIQVKTRRVASSMLVLALFALIALSIMLVVWQFVVLKMLPFDNKSEFQVVVDMPEGTPLEQTQLVLQALSREILQIPEVENVQTYAGTAAPVNFNGLLRQYYLRKAAYQGDIQVNLIDKHHRERQSHDIAMSIRPTLKELADTFNAAIKIVEVPPGPPVLSPIVAEVYGLDSSEQKAVAAKVLAIFRDTQDIVDVDSTLSAPQKKLQLVVKRNLAAALGISQQQIVDTLRALLGGNDLSFWHEDFHRYPIPIRLELSAADAADINGLKNIKLISSHNEAVPLSEIVEFNWGIADSPIYHKNLKPVIFVTADAAGKLDSPLYGMFAMVQSIANENLIPQQFIDTKTTANYFLKWDGEWQITYETFRDMGIAYAVGLILIYLLVVAQFRSYLIPLLIMLPIPFTIIGVMPGHALMSAQFTATSMIGMIALAGIIVRNSILLVDFIRHAVSNGKSLAESTIEAAAVRARPIILTALAAMIGGFFIMDDPIFKGLAVSLIFGIFIATLLTLVVIPVVYFWLMNRE